MMNKVREIDWFANEIVKKNMTLTWLISKARKLPFCRRQILITKILCWDKHISLLAYDIISNRKCSIYDVNFRCREFVEENNLANKNFIKFFFNFHKGIGDFYMQKLEETIKAAVDIKTKIVSLFYLFCELMNITRIELENFDIDCAVIGNNRMCKDHNCKDMPNVITLMITPEYIANQAIINGVIDSLKHIVDKDKVILVVDYRNLCAHIRYGEYTWRKEGAWCRYNKCKKYVKEIYFYKYECVDFGIYKEALEPYFIRTEKQLKEIYNANNGTA